MKFDILKNFKQNDNFRHYVLNSLAVRYSMRLSARYQGGFKDHTQEKVSVGGCVLKYGLQL